MVTGLNTTAVRNSAEEIQLENGLESGIQTAEAKAASSRPGSRHSRKA